MYKCIKSTVWYSLTFEAGEVYNIDDMLASRLLRAGVIKPYKETVKAIPEEVEPEVEQPETPSVFKPVATSIEPLPETDDLAITPIVESKKIVEVIAKHRKPKGKKK